MLAAYLGCIVGAGWLGGMPFGINLYWSLADVWQVLIPPAAIKSFKADVGLRIKRDLAVFIGFGWLLNNIAGAAWGASTLALGGLASWSEAPVIFTGWLIGNLIVTGAIAPLLLRYGTPWIEEHELLVTGYWT
jgi:hypothetical protein